MNLQNEYILIQEGKGNIDFFMKNVRNLFPKYFNQYSSFNEAVNLLKSKNLIFEAKAKTEKKSPSPKLKMFDLKDKKNIDNMYGDRFINGFYCEIQNEKNKSKSIDEIKEIVRKNLAKDPLYYVKNFFFGVEGIGLTQSDEPKAPKGKHKSSGYGNLNESIDSMGWKNLTPEEREEHVGKYVKDYDDVEKYIQMDNLEDLPDYLYSNITRDLRENQYYDSDPSDGDYDFDKRMESEANRLYDEGQEEFNNGNFEKAEQLRQLALKAGSHLSWYDSDLPPYKKINTTNMNLKEIIQTVLREQEEKTSELKPKTKKKDDVFTRIKNFQKLSEETALRTNVDALTNEIKRLNEKINMAETMDELQEFVNPIKIKEIQREIKELEKHKSKNEKLLERLTKGSKKIVTGNGEPDEVYNPDSEYGDDGINDDLVKEGEETSINKLKISKPSSGGISFIDPKIQPLLGLNRMSDSYLRVYNDYATYYNADVNNHGEKNLNYKSQILKFKRFLDSKNIPYKVEEKVYPTVGKTPSYNYTTIKIPKSYLEYELQSESNNIEETMDDSKETLFANIKDKLDDIVDSGRAGSVEKAVEMYLRNHPEHNKYKNDIARLIVR